MTKLEVKNRRRALITRRSVVVARRARRMDPMVKSVSLAAERRHARERMLRGMEPIDHTLEHTLEHAGNPDHEIDQLPDSLTGYRAS